MFSLASRYLNSVYYCALQYSCGNQPLLVASIGEHRALCSVGDAGSQLCFLMKFWEGIRSFAPQGGGGRGRRVPSPVPAGARPVWGRGGTGERLRETPVG